MHKSLIAIAALAAIGTASAAFADKVELTNGDILTGKIVGSDEKTLTLKSDKPGEIKIDLVNVKTFSTDEPINVHLKDGTVLTKKASAGEPGIVKVEKGDTPTDNFRLDRVSSI